MQWCDEAIVLSLRSHGETAGILELLTREHGRHLGVVHGSASSRVRSTLQPGNRLNVTWRARVPEHLGVLAVEPSCTRAARFFEKRNSLVALNAAIAIAAAVLPEREPHATAYQDTEVLIDAIPGGDILDWGPLFVFWELGLLNELGFGLDMSVCAVTGTSEDLIYVSPRSGRAVSRETGENYRDRLLSLPPFLRDSAVQAPLTDISAGLQLTARATLSAAGRLRPTHRLPQCRGDPAAPWFRSRRCCSI